ncbi:asparagine synthetase B family protein, partial [Flavobacterium sp.]|uniref:asparagine synthetase B family protein n=1 Tax=Flavobacterium sp. TaxID=239 RepID=UPI003751E7C9
MCGIVGIINTNAKSLIVPMNNQIKHRGPDKSETYTFDNLGLGHQRLSILDLAPTGDQPMFSHDKRYVIIFNGEIYNHLEIREPIKNKYPFKSSGDTETILYAFIEYGVALFSKLNGIFAFSIFDHETKELIVVRDHFGIKPLYYYLKKDVFMFGSEIKSFLPYPAFEKTLDYEALV